MQAKKSLGIIVKPENRARIEAALEAVQRQCRTRCIDYDKIEAALRHVDEFYALRKTEMAGVKVSVDWHAQYFAKAYKYTPESTHFEAVYTGHAWKLIDVYRGYTRSAGHAIEVEEMPEKTAQAIMAQHTSFGSFVW